MVVVVVLVCAFPAFAADTAGANSPFYGNAIGAGFGAALTTIGAGFGFGRIGSAALESMARQPEVAGRVQTGMLIIAALLEGATFFALIVCIIMATKA
ncbi:MAG: ATP synthase F0 subunit C [Gemmatales bacterium]|nr:ATP synthase F0 subunit C [Gemmatales bacterium]